MVLIFPKGSNLTAHALAAKWDVFSPVPTEAVSGLVCPLTAYEFRGKFILIKPPVCYVPGSKVQKEISVEPTSLGILVYERHNI